MNIKTTLTIWTISLVLTAASMASFGWLFFSSVTVFFLVSLYINREKKRFEGDLDEMFGIGDSFE